MNSGTETLYYDGQCPLCNAEMARLGAYEPAGLELLDIHQLELDEAIKHQMLKNLHLKTADGSFKIGLDANIAAWQHTRWGWAWQSLRLPGIGWIAGRIYKLWAEQRYSRLYDKSKSELS